jgi:hypothetical protein
MRQSELKPKSCGGRQNRLTLIVADNTRAVEIDRLDCCFWSMPQRPVRAVLQVRPRAEHRVAWRTGACTVQAHVDAIGRCPASWRGYVGRPGPPSMWCVSSEKTLPHLRLVVYR